MSLPGTAKPTTIGLLRDHYVQQADDWRRDHLGCSILGGDCERRIWLTFRWAGPKNFDGRMERLLERGKREEVWLLDDLEMIGVEVLPIDPATSQQWRVRWGHVGGSVDAMVQGLAERGGWHVAEVKTSNAKQFSRLQQLGVKKAKPDHYVQMQLYMHGHRMPEHAVYISVCKDNDEIHIELVDYDPKVAGASLAKGERLAVADFPPAKHDALAPPCVYTSKDGTRWPCEFYGQCHGTARPVKSCRTCINATPMPNGTWRCEKMAKELTPQEQRDGCGEHLTIPEMVNAQVVDVTEQAITYQASTGETWVDRMRTDGQVNLEAR